MKKILALSLGVVLLAAACNKKQAADNQQPTQGTAEISMTASGFSPQSITVKKGRTVVFKNTNTNPHWPASSPHPQHTDLPGFDPLRGIGAGESYSFTFDKTGTWKFHDHLNPTLFGSVTVVE